MKKLIWLITLVMSITPSFSRQKASAEWLTDGVLDKGSNTIQTIVQMSIQEGWHAYWMNPGESGLPPTLKAKLPDGWKVGNLHYPVPIRFATGELQGFGYEGKVNIPLDLIPPADFTGDLPLMSGTLSWLTCSDESCVPGRQEVKLSKGEHSEMIKASYASLPKQLQDAKLSVALNNDIVSITLELPETSEINPSEFEVYPITPDIVAPSAKPAFVQDSSKKQTWNATAPKNEFLSEAPKEFAILLKGVSKSSFTASTAK
jgi:DsbC/DsbD-like thiol-disulfide interchange protein